jgi:hypothetical protein
MRPSVATVALALALGLAACAPGRPPEVDAVLALRGPGDTVDVRHLAPPEGGEVGERWELTFTTAEPEALVDAVRHHYIAQDFRIDDANDGLGFTAGSSVEVREIFTTAPGARKILVTLGCCIATYN